MTAAEGDFVDDPFGTDNPELDSSQAQAPDALGERHCRIADRWFDVLRAAHPTVWAVASILSVHARTEDGQRKCWPRQETIADRLRVHPKTVSRAFTLLRKIGFITGSKRRYGKSSYVFIDDYKPKGSNPR